MNGQTVWITGLSGAGKSTISRGLVAQLRRQGDVVVMLDGDELREIMGAAGLSGGNHTRDSRIALAMRYAQLCKLIASQGPTVVIATISLFREVHLWNRANLPGYFEVYLKVPVDELRRRDSKKIYSRFDAGELHDVAGLDLPIDEPVESDWVSEFSPERTADVITNELVKILATRKRT